DTGSEGNLTVPLPQMAARGKEDLLNPADITQRYLRQNWSGTIARGQDDPPPPPPQEWHGQWNPPPAPWLKRSFTLTVSQLPADLPTYLGDLPGAVVNSITFTPGSSLSTGWWTIEGVIYENRV